MKLKELILEDIKFTSKELSTGSIINVSYQDTPFEFQIPKGDIHFIENDKILLKVTNKTFIDKINTIEKFLSNRFNREIISTIEDNLISLKLPFKFSKPMFKVYHENKQFNYFNLVAGNEIICLVTLDKVWISNKINYCLNIKEIMLLKQ